MDQGGVGMISGQEFIKRFEAYCWQTLYVADGNDVNAINAAIEEAKADKERPDQFWGKKYTPV